MLFTFLKGFAMGLADVVPGVSGGTMALITGIYDRLIEAISKGLTVFRHPSNIFKLDWGFLLPLAIGIASAIFTGAFVVTWAIEKYPSFIYSLFFGLILASSLLMYKQRDWKNNYVLTGVGFFIVGVLAFLSPLSIEPPLWLLFIGGLIAVSAMVLPGISGSYLLLLMGMYAYVLDLVRNLVITELAVFIAGAFVGGCTMVILINKLLHIAKPQIFSVLLGFVLGGLILLIRYMLVGPILWQAFLGLVLGTLIPLGIAKYVPKQEPF